MRRTLYTAPRPPLHMTWTYDTYICVAKHSKMFSNCAIDRSRLADRLLHKLNSAMTRPWGQFYICKHGLGMCWRKYSSVGLRFNKKWTILFSDLMHVASDLLEETIGFGMKHDSRINRLICNSYIQTHTRKAKGYWDIIRAVLLSF